MLSGSTHLTLPTCYFYNELKYIHIESFLSFHPTGARIMQNVLTLRHSLIAIACSMSVTALAQTSTGGTTSESEATAGGSIEEVIVTAQKREERLQDVPISITVQTGEVLDKATFEGISE